MSEDTQMVAIVFAFLSFVALCITVGVIMTTC